jgi:hypothetical protein
MLSAVKGPEATGVGAAAAGAPPATALPEAGADLLQAESETRATPAIPAAIKTRIDVFFLFEEQPCRDTG